MYIHWSLICVCACAQGAIMLGEAFLHVLNCTEDTTKHDGHSHTLSSTLTTCPDPCMTHATARSPLPPQTVRGERPQNSGLLG